ncbi:MAG: GspE/PulE family protein [Bacteroidota bacterium]
MLSLIDNLMKEQRQARSASPPSGVTPPAESDTRPHRMQDTPPQNEAPAAPWPVAPEESALLDFEEALAATLQATEESTARRQDPEAPSDRLQGAETPIDPLLQPLASAPENDDEALRDLDHELARPDEHEEIIGDGSFDIMEVKDRVAIMLQFYELVREHHIERAWYKAQQEETPRALWRIIAEDTSVDPEQIFRTAASVYAFEEVDTEASDISSFLDGIREDLTDEQWSGLRALSVVPVDRVGGDDGQGRFILGAYDPTRSGLLRELKRLGLRSFDLKFLGLSTIERLYSEFWSDRKNEYLERISDSAVAVDLGTEYEAEESSLIDNDKLEAEISSSTLLNLFEAALIEAVRKGVSDLHIFPNADRHVEIHFRKDGQLECWHVEKRVSAEAFLAIVKDNSTNVDRFERESAQDGFIQRRIDNTLIRFRVSVLPIANSNLDLRSESIVIRVLDDRKVVTDLRKLGLLEAALERFEIAIRQPHGMVILTGPTGSGKSTTLFAALHQVVTPKINVLTVEDPVEYIIPGVRQIKLGNKLDLELALRAILRHDPDVVMVGEMRDRLTAELAIKLANTGHLTFSTLHTNDAASAVSRLYKMGVEPFLIAYAINLVVAQRLIRKVCPTCRIVDTNPNPRVLERAGFAPGELEGVTIYKAAVDPSCETCGGIGYKGRRAITETMLFSEDIREAIIDAGDKIDETALNKIAIREGMLTLQASAREVVKMGETTLEELIRITASQM